MPRVVPTIHILASRIYRPSGRVALIRAAARATLAQTQISSDAELSIRLGNDADLRALNKKYRGVDKPTDVLSFGGEQFNDGTARLPPHPSPLPHPSTGAQEEREYLGDMVISMERCAAQAHEFGHALDDELTLLVIHGMLHLCGFDHPNAQRRKTMWQAQDRAFAALGRPNPLRPGQFHN